MSKILYKLRKNVYDVIKMRQLKNRTFLRVLAEYLKNRLTDFNQTYVTSGQSYIEVFEIKRLDIGHSLLPW